MPPQPSHHQPRIDWMFLAAWLAHLPVGMQYAIRMWREGHYQFFPLLMLVVAWLLWDRLSGVPRRAQRCRWTYLLLGLNSVWLLLATLLFSPFLWIQSFLLLIGIQIFDRFGRRGVILALPVWALLLFIVPLPKGWDLTAIQQLQFVASTLASWILDSFGQTHFREGVVLITEQKQFFTEEACSGVRSLFSSCAAMAIYGVTQRYGWGRHLFNLVQTMIWVIAGNAIRVAIVVFVADNYYEGIASGTPHEILGLAMFVAIFGLALCTDRSLNAWLDPQPASDQLANSSCTPEMKSGSVDLEMGGHWARWARLAFTLGFSGLLLFGGRLAIAEISGNAWEYHLPGNVVSEDLPESLLGWQQVDFHFEAREASGLLAPESYVWIYRRGRREVAVSLDGPYYEFHNLKSCYSGLGWDVDYSHHYTLPESSAGAEDNFTWIDMHKENQQGQLIFSAFDRHGATVIPTSMVTWKQEMLNHVQFAVRSTKQLPVSQIQLLNTSPADTARLPKEELQALFFEVRQRLLAHPGFSRNSPDE